MQDFKVRLARPEDENAIYNLLVLMHEENGLFSMDEETVRGLVHDVVSNKKGVVGIIQSDGEIEAAICLMINNLWYTQDYCISDLFNFVAPQYRKSTRAKSLIQFAKNYADEIGIPLFMGIVSNVRTEAKIKLMERQMDKAGAFFIYNYPIQRAETLIQ